jgi:hypothetical protein
MFHEGLVIATDPRCQCAPAAASDNAAARALLAKIIRATEVRDAAELLA